MFARLRRQRWLAPLLFLLSPATAGVGLPLFHPCPVDMPWMAAGSGGGHHHAMAEGHHAAGHGDAQGEGHACLCIGCCSAPYRVAPPAVPVVAHVVDRPAAPVPAFTETLPTAWYVLRLLPEATAPPLV